MMVMDRAAVSMEDHQTMLILCCFLQGSGNVSTESIMAMFGSKTPAEETKQA